MYGIDRQSGLSNVAEMLRREGDLTLRPPPKALGFNVEAVEEAVALAAEGEFRMGAVLERMGCGYVFLDEAKQIIKISALARRLLDSESEITPGTAAGRRHVLQKLVDRGRGRLTCGSLTWVAVSRENGLTLTFGQTPDVKCAPRTIVVLLDLDAHSVPNPDVLKRLFGLTLAESSLAMELAQGSTPDEAARRRRVSRTTVRSQLGSIFAKTNTRRQAALVSLLARIALIP
jgi:DNA-binding CsgD family transcriptional regulator